MPGPAPRRGAMLALVFAFAVIQMFVLSTLQQRMAVLALTEERLRSTSSEVPEPGVLALSQALELLRTGDLPALSTRSVLVSHGGTTYTYSAHFALEGALWRITITPPADLPAELAYPIVRWP